MITLILIPAIGLPMWQTQAQRAAALDPYVFLGWQRSNIGPGWKPGDQPFWSYQVKINSGGESMMIFPSGRADNRYLINEEHISHKVGFDTTQDYLVYDEIHGKDVKHLWRVLLDAIPLDLEKMPEILEPLGTIERFLARRGLYQSPEP